MEPSGVFLGRAPSKFLKIRVIPIWCILVHLKLHKIKFWELESAISWFLGPLSLEFISSRDETSKLAILTLDPWFDPLFDPLIRASHLTLYVTLYLVLYLVLYLTLYLVLYLVLYLALYLALHSTPYLTLYVTLHLTLYFKRFNDIFWALRRSPFDSLWNLTQT